MVSNMGEYVQNARVRVRGMLDLEPLYPIAFIFASVFCLMIAAGYLAT